MNHKPNRFNDILTNIVTGVTITAWGTAVILLLIKLAIWYSNNPQDDTRHETMDTGLMPTTRNQHTT